jgi:hypothetical protein
MILETGARRRQKWVAFMVDLFSISLLQRRKMEVSASLNSAQMTHSEGSNGTESKFRMVLGPGGLIVSIPLSILAA